jgi:NADH-quinone oxidoreductase subunit M
LTAQDARWNEKLVLAVLVVVILMIGVYPKPMLQLTETTVDTIISRMITKHP